MPSTDARVVLSGISPNIKGLEWQGENRLTICRDPKLDIVLEEPTIAPQHAQVSATSRRSVGRDLGSRSGTFLNGLPVGKDSRRLQLQDVLHCGHSAFRVTALQESRQPAPTLPLPEKLDIRATRIVPTIKSATKRSLAMQSLTQDQ